MRMVMVNRRETVIPDTWEDAARMLEDALDPYWDQRGRNMERMSVAARVAYGMFGEQYTAPDPTTALISMLQAIAERKGAGLHASTDPRKDSSGSQ